MLNRLRAWYGTWPLQRRVAYLTSAAVALAVAVTSIAGYVTLRISLYSALDAELIDIATSLNVTVARDIQSYGGLTDKALRAGNIRVEAIRADGQTFRVPDAAVAAGAGRRRGGGRPAAPGFEHADRRELRRPPLPDHRHPDGRVAQLRPGAGPTAGGDRPDPERPVAGPDHLRHGRRADRPGGRRHRGPLQPAARTRAARRGRAGHRHQGAAADLDQRRRRHGPAGRVVQQDAPLAGLVAGAAAAG